MREEESAKEPRQVKPEIRSGEIRILFFGCCVLDEDFPYIVSNEKGSVQYAAQKVCWFFIKGVEGSLSACDLLLSLRVSSYPLFNRIFACNLEKRQRGNGRHAGYVPYLNLPGLRYPTTMFMAALRLAGWLWRTKKAPGRCIIVYAMYLPHILPALLLSRLCGAKTVMIVPDLPEYMNFSPRGRVNSWLREINVRIAHRVSAGFDGLVLFSRNMAQKIDCRKLSWTVVEGCVDVTPGEPEPLPVPPRVERAIMYSGTLDRAYGVGNLVEAFRQIPDPKLELWLCGCGDMEAEIRKHAGRDPRIRFHGMLPNREVLSMQQRALLLINPRSNDQEFTRYSFPSKNLEYMSSGRPVILCRMDGIPEEYYRFVLAAGSGSAGSIRDAIRSALALPAGELDALGARAREFVAREKNYLAQGEKIRHLVLEIFESRTT